MMVDLSGLWKCEIPGRQGEIRLPGTLDEAGFGMPDDPRRQWKAEEVRRIGFWREGDPIVTRFTRRVTFEGQAKLSRRLCWQVPAGERIFIEAERARHLRLMVNGRECAPSRPLCLSAPAVFEATGLMTGEDEVTFLSDNSYPGWPRDAIVYSSAASDETQTNWNGLPGYLRLRTEKKNFCASLRVYPRGETLEVVAELDLTEDWEGKIRIVSPALREEKAEAACGPLAPGRREVRFCLPLKEGLKRWDLDEGNLYPVQLIPEGMEGVETDFGVRDFAAREGRLTLNGRRFFLRGEANCAVFPETGYCPMTVAAWEAVLSRYRAYGVNTMRFHSHCPPEAAFAAADRLGMLMQPELSHWDPEHAFATSEARAYYAAEAEGILRQLANHPSFVMMTLGNELQADEAGRAFMTELLGKMRGLDPTRLYANGSNPFYGQRGPDPASDFYTSSDDRGQMLRATSAEYRGWLNEAEPSADRDYSREMARLRETSDAPVFSFEVGQYEVLPDFGEIPLFQGVTRPDNLWHIQKKVREAGLEAAWPQWVEASGENALRCYRAEVEAALRTEAFSGISLLGLQDFPGQGTALVGMMNSHLQPKPYRFAKPERFAAFFRDVLPLALLPRFVFLAGEEVSVPVRLANYGKEDLKDCLAWRLEGEGVKLNGCLEEGCAACGCLTEVGTIRFRLPQAGTGTQLRLQLSFAGFSNEYPLWVYPEARPVCPAGVYECRALDERARAVLADGGRVFLAPDSTAEGLPCSVQAQYSPDFWSVCTFPTQNGCMGQLMDADHPVFRSFPTERFTTAQWKPMTDQRAMLLPRPMKAIVTEMDSYAFLRPMAKLLECRCGGGRLMISSFGLHQLQDAPNARALLQAIYDYMASGDFLPEQELTLEEAAAFLPVQ